MDEIKLSSVNWQHGMLLSPQHFVRQEEYIDALVRWTLRYMSPAYGLVGGGPRLEESERGAVRHDPIVVLDEDEETIGISITQARGITPCGRIVESSKIILCISVSTRQNSQECLRATSIWCVRKKRKKRMEGKTSSTRK